jgi:hypothetical protein
VVLEFWVRPHLLGGGRIKSFPKRSPNHQKLFINYGDTVLRLAGNTKVTKSGIKVELYPDKKQNSFNMLIREVFLCSNSRGTRNSFKFFSLKT